MAYGDIKQPMVDFLAELVARIKDALSHDGVMVSQTGGGGLQLTSGRPVTLVQVAENDVDVASLQAGTEDFLDLRNSHRWTYDGGWSSALYHGDDGWLRPNTLCYSVHNGQLYHSDEFVHLRPVTLTDS